MAELLDVARIPSAWLVQADRLKRAADLVGSQFQGEANAWFLAEASLWTQPAEPDEAAVGRRIAAFELALPAYMLVGYAIEVLVKGLIVVRDTSDETVQWLTRRHLSLELVDKAGLDLSQAERFLIEQRLYHAVRWAGRYPAPIARDARKFEADIAAAQGVIFSDPRAVSPDHYRQARELLDRLEAELVEAIAEERRSRLSPPQVSTSSGETATNPPRLTQTRPLFPVRAALVRPLAPVFPFSQDVPSLFFPDRSCLPSFRFSPSSVRRSPCLRAPTLPQPFEVGALPWFLTTRTQCLFPR